MEAGLLPPSSLRINSHRSSSTNPLVSTKAATLSRSSASGGGRNASVDSNSAGTVPSRPLLRSHVSPANASTLGRALFCKKALRPAPGRCSCAEDSATSSSCRASATSPISSRSNPRSSASDGSGPNWRRGTASNALGGGDAEASSLQFKK